MGSRKHRRRDAHTTAIANPKLSRPTLNVIKPTTLLKTLEDRRTYHPMGPTRPAKKLSGVPSSHKLRPQPKNVNLAKKPKSKLLRVTRGPGGRPLKSKPHSAHDLKQRLMMKEPLKTVICLKRKIRSEVLFAKKYAGKSGAKKNKPRRNAYSNIGC
nr:MAG: hypothetical protein [Microvirus sp.]